MTEQHETRDGKTWQASQATLWICHETGEVVVTGDPRAVEPEGCPEDLGHDCDAAGCGQDHVLARGWIVGSQASLALTWRPGGG